MKKYAIVVAGGLGKRFQSDTPKQFISINEKPLFYYSAHNFFESFSDIEIVLVVPIQFLNSTQDIVSKLYLPKQSIKVVCGGKERFHSVKNGLAEIMVEEGIVAIHDAVRPFLKPALIRHLFIEAEHKNSAVPCISPRDSTLSKNDKGEWKHKDRDQLRLIQTPQIFLLSRLRFVYENTTYSEDIKDDSYLMEKHGFELNYVEGNPHNVKITYPEDLDIPTV